MALLGALFVSLASGLATFFVQFLTRKLAIAAAAVAAFGAVTVALLAGFNGLVSPLVAQLFSTSYGQVLGLAFPPVAGTCMAAIGLCWSACTLYKWQVKAISLAAVA